MKTLGVVTGSRADYGIYRPVLCRLAQDPTWRVRLLVTGMHLAPAYGMTVQDIVADGFAIHERIDTLLAADTPEGIAKSMGLGVLGFTQAYARCRPDLLLVLGDRFEMFAAAAAAVPFALPVAHIHGGEVTAGAMDEQFRHAMTKMSHVHFVATPAYAERVIQMGEEPWRVVVSGAPGLDNLRDVPCLSRLELARRYGLPAHGPFLLVTYHPVTLEHTQAAQQMGELLAALAEVDVPLVCTAPNADTSNLTLREMLTAFATQYPRACLVTHLGTQAYLSAMHYATAMVGNSSSGIIEAASFRLPVVNIGTRQQGRVRTRNVIDVGYARHDILAAVHTAMSPQFRAGLADLHNPYGDGHAAERIVQTLAQLRLDQTLLQKRFCTPGVPLT